MVNPLYDQLFGRYQGRDDTFLILPDGSGISYDVFLRMAARFANQMRAAGLKPGDRLAVQIEKSPEALAIYAGAVAAGVVFLPLNIGYTATEMAYFIGNSGAGLVIADGAQAKGLKPVAKEAGAKLMVLNADGSGSFAKAAAGRSDQFDPVERTEDDLAAFLYTSGTTGRSKGAMLSQRNLLSNAEVLTECWRFTDKDTLLHALPIFHTHGLFVATNICLLAGAPIILLPKFDVDEVLRLMPRATAMMGVPTFYTRLLDAPGFTREAAAHMRLFVSGSAPLLAETHVQFQDRTGHRILERYGMTETNMNTSNPYEGDRRAGTVGLPLPGVEVKVCDAEGHAVPDGEIGVIEVRGPNVFQGYWQMPEKTAEEMRPDGFFITGDLGVISDDGYVSIVGRAKDLIISGGYNIYPKEIEDVLDAQADVLESAVIGVPDADFGEAVLGLIVPQKGKFPDLETISATVAGQLARFKQPRRLLLVPELPRNTMGKVQKAALRDQYRDALDG